MLGEGRYSEGGQDIWLSEETIHDLVLETWSGALSTLSEEDRFSLRLEQSTTDLFDEAPQHYDLLGSARSSKGDYRYARLFEPAQVLSDYLGPQHISSEGDSGLELSNSRGAGRLDANLNLSFSDSQDLRSSSEIHEQFPTLETVGHTPGILSDRRQIFTEVRHPLELAEDLDVINFLERWGQEHI